MYELGSPLRLPRVSLSLRNEGSSKADDAEREAKASPLSIPFGRHWMSVPLARGVRGSEIALREGTVALDRFFEGTSSGPRNLVVSARWSFLAPRDPRFLPTCPDEASSLEPTENRVNRPARQSGRVHDVETVAMAIGKGP